MQRPTEDHMQALRRLLRYLSGTSHMGLIIHKNTPLHLHAYSNADWARDKDDYISTTAYIVYLGENPISWASRKQSTRARSSTEAEYRVMPTPLPNCYGLKICSRNLAILSQARQ